MNIREDNRETIKYYVFLVTAKMFFIAVVFINPDIKTALLLIIGIIFKAWAEKTDHKIAQSRPQDLREGIKYIFCGADSKNNFLWLEEHIHEKRDVALNISQHEHLPIESYPPIEFYDYDKPGIFNGVVFSQDLKVGEIVIRHEIEKGYVGIIRLRDYNQKAV